MSSPPSPSPGTPLSFSFPRGERERERERERGIEREIVCPPPSLSLPFFLHKVARLRPWLELLQEALPQMVASLGCLEVSSRFNAVVFCKPLPRISTHHLLLVHRIPYLDFLLYSARDFPLIYVRQVYLEGFFNLCSL